jgi:hypothetical protein
MTIVQSTKTTLRVVLAQYFRRLFILVIVYWRCALYERLHNFSTSLMIMNPDAVGAENSQIFLFIQNFLLHSPLNTEYNLKNR